MTSKAVKTALDTATQLLNENMRQHIDPNTQPAERNLNLALIHICTALEKIADDIHTIERRG